MNVSRSRDSSTSDSGTTSVDFQPDFATPDIAINDREPIIRSRHDSHNGGIDDEYSRSAAELQAEGQSDNHGSNINVRAAFIHVIGDFLQSLGVLASALIIYLKVSQ